MKNRWTRDLAPWDVFKLWLKLSQLHRPWSWRVFNISPSDKTCILQRRFYHKRGECHCPASFSLFGVWKWNTMFPSCTALITACPFFGATERFWDHALNNGCVITYRVIYFDEGKAIISNPKSVQRLKPGMHERQGTRETMARTIMRQSNLMNTEWSTRTEMSEEGEDHWTITGATYWGGTGKQAIK